MISWMQRILQKHYKWLFTIMLAIIIVAFVFTIGGSPGIGRSKISTKKQMYYGVNLNNPDQIRELFRNANISNILNTGQSITNNQVAENLSLARPPLLTLAHKFQLLHPNEYELTEYIKTRPLFKQADGNFDPKKYQDFIQLVKSDKNLNEHIIREVLAQDEQMDNTSQLIGGPGYTLPFEATFIIARQKTLWSVDIATLDVKDLTTNTTIPEDKLEEYYTTNKLNFATPALIEIAYAMFPLEEFLSKVPTPASATLKEFYESHPNLFTQEDEKDKSFEKNKDKALESYKKDRAARLAAEAADSFQSELYHNYVPFNSEGFKKLLKKHKVTLTHIPPFDKNTLPQGTSVPQKLLREALTLNEQNYFSDVASSDKGSFMVFFKKEHHTYVPPFEEIKQQLHEELLSKESYKLLESKAKILDKTLVTAVKTDKSFKKIAKEEGLKVTSFDKFKILEAPEGLDKTLLPDIQKLNKGDVSPFIMRDDRVYFIHISDKEIPTIQENDPEVQSLLIQLDSFSSMARIHAITSELITKGLEKSEKS